MTIEEIKTHLDSHISVYFIKGSGYLNGHIGLRMNCGKEIIVLHPDFAHISIFLDPEEIERIVPIK